MTKKPLFIAAILTSSAAAFGLGWQLKPSTAALSTNAPTAGTAGVVQITDTTNSAVTSEGGAVRKSTNSEGAFATFMRSGTITAEKMGAAVKRVMDENDPLKKRALFTELLAELTPENAVAAYDAIRENSRGRGGRGGWGNGDGDDTRLLLNAWGRIDGAGAIAELQAREEKRKAEAKANGEDPNGRRGGRDGGGTFDMYSIVNGWATVDSSAASEFVTSIEDDRQRGMLANGVVQGLLVNGVDDALSFVTNLPADDESRSRHMSTIAGEMMEQGAQAAANWVSSITDDDLKGGAMNRIAESYAREDIEGAVSWITEHAGNDYANRAVGDVAERWAESDPQAVIDWASNLPESAQAGAFEEALDEWTEKDPVAASEYLAQMPDSAAKNSAIEGFATELADSDGESAVTWAQTITDTDLRDQTIQRVARDWYQQDQEAASTWLLSSGLPEETITNIAKPSERGRGGWDRRGGR
ncbi:MAG: hypothetical protein ACI9R3_000787 [Verrucomicrobiales bacterium]|jgi:hypothetical protein